MLANRLKILLAERDLSIKDVIEGTGISRNVLSNMINNPYANVSTNNINKLCNFLEVIPNDFYDYFPWNFKLGHSLKEKLPSFQDQEICVGNFLVRGVSGHKIADTGSYIFLKRNHKNTIYDYDLEISLKNPSSSSFKDLYEEMSPLFKHSIEEAIRKDITKLVLELENHYHLTKSLKKAKIDVRFVCYDKDSANTTIFLDTMFKISFVNS